MIVLDAKEFISLLHNMIALEALSRGNSSILEDHSKKRLSVYHALVDTSLGKLFLPVSRRMADNKLSKVESFGEFASSIKSVYETICIEMEEKKFYAPTGDLEKYFEKQELFGREVFEKFPSANNDIFESGTCLALDRATACVMHLMRVVECGLAVLAKRLEVSRQNDWGSYIREIEKALAKALVSSGKRTPQEQFYAEAVVVFDGMRKAWRNPTMHVENTYSADRAEEILISVRMFMRHLATGLSEAGAP